MLGFDACPDCAGYGTFTLNGKTVVCGIEPPREAFIPSPDYPGRFPGGLAFKAHWLAMRSRPPGPGGRPGKIRTFRRAAQDAASRQYWQEYLAPFTSRRVHSAEEINERRRGRKEAKRLSAVKRIKTKLKPAEDG